MIDVLRDYGAAGFLIEASVADITPTGGGSYSVNYGSRRTNIFYASTYAKACEKAIAWGEGLADEMKAGKPNSSTEAPQLTLTL